MGKLPQISGKELCKALEKEGFFFVRQTGSHRIYQKKSEEGNITIPIPIHSNKPLKKGTLCGILRKTGITKEKLVFLIALLMKLH